MKEIKVENFIVVVKLLNFCYSLKAPDGFIQPIFYKRFDCFNL